MNLLDIFIVIFLVVSLLRGLEVGFVRQFFSTVGFIGGLLLGAWLQGYLIDLVNTPASKAILVVVVVLGCALGLMVLGEYIGLKIKFKLRDTPLINKFDRIFGSLLGIASILAIVWLGAAIFRGIPSQTWQHQINGSRIITVLNNNLPSAPNVISSLGHLINPNLFPQVFTGLEPQLQTDAPLPELGDLRPAVDMARESTVKIQGEGCGGIVEGSGFVAGRDLIITNAHVVAGVQNPKVVDADGSRPAKVVLFDPELDLAILKAGGLAGKPLELDARLATNGTAAVVLGYPQGSGFTAIPANIVETFTAKGRDIYNQDETERQVFALNASIHQGNSGGPLITADRSVVGVIFAQSVSYENVGYALTMDQVLPKVAQAQDRESAVTTGKCAR